MKEITVWSTWLDPGLFFFFFNLKKKTKAERFQTKPSPLLHWGWKDSSVVKLDSQHPWPVAHNCLKLKLQEIQCSLLASKGTAHRCAHKHTYVQENK